MRVCEGRGGGEGGDLYTSAARVPTSWFVTLKKPVYLVCLISSGNLFHSGEAKQIGAHFKVSVVGKGIGRLSDEAALVI